jgi:hypothetical protein
MIVPTHARTFATASLADRFEVAYEARQASLNNGPAKVHEPENKELYGKSYYQDKLHQMRSGYQHPYHKGDSPLVYSHYQYMKLLFEAVGPEQVSPHYESLSRSRRGIIFLFGYIATITSISKLGGWSHNEWMRGMIFHHEFLIAFYLGVAETRHFQWFPSPKFSVFYDIYSNYELAQFGNHWADVVEEQQMQHLQHSKEQMEYMRINNEYEFVKKRSLVNFLTTQRVDLENHFHARASSMLTTIERYEASNLKGMLNGIGSGALSKLNATLADPEESKAIKEASFQSALQGIRDGSMSYKGDPLMPILTGEIEARVNSFKSLSPAEETAMMALTADQKKLIVEADKRDRLAFLHTQPNINNAGVKTNQKYLNYVESLKSAQ